MLIQLRIQNFKSWRDTGSMRFAPLTGFFGANSSGKTGILQFLLMLKQTMESAQPSQVFDFGSSDYNWRSYVNLGTFADIIFRHTLSDRLSFDFTWSIDGDGKIGQVEYEFPSRFDQMTLHADVSQKQSHEVVLDCLAYFFDSYEIKVIRQDTNGSPRYRLQTNVAAESNLPAEMALSTPYKFYGLPAELRKYNLRSAYFGANLEGALERIHYLGPLREYPSRFYIWTGAEIVYIGPRGEYTIPALLFAKHDNEMRTFRGYDLQEKVAGWLRRLDLISEFNLKPIAPDRQEFEVRIRQTPDSPEVLLTEVGFGVSQVLPVLTLCYLVPSGSTIILEQPEIHLHPAIQAGLADVFIDVIKTRNVQIILESHSEHLLRRLQRRMAEEKLTPADVALYFTRIEEGESKLEELKVDEYGNISNWPQNFFGDEMGDLVAMTRAAMRRQGAVDAEEDEPAG